MNIKKELDAMESRIFSDGLVERIFADTLLELQEEDFEITEQEYREGRAALAEILDDGQKAQLAELDRLNGRLVDLGVRFSFPRGIGAGFRREHGETAYEQLVSDPLQRTSTAHPAYADVHRRVREIEDALCDALSEEDAEHVVSVIVGWEERVFGALRHAFSLGYCFALTVSPRPDVPLEEAVRTLERQMEFSTGWFSL